MKLSKLFVLGAFGFASLSVSAADLIERQAPSLDVVEETPVAFEVGKEYILFNTGAEMYFTQGSNWSTRGCVVPNKASAVRIKVAKYTLNDVWDGKTYEIQNYVTNRSSYSWYKMCMNGAGDLYLDQTTWSRFVEIQPQGGNVYRIMPNEVNNTIEGDNGGVVSDGTQFVGYAGLAYDSGNDSYDFSQDNGGIDDKTERVPLSALTTENVDWVFYSTAAYEAALELFNKAEELKALIGQAEEAGVQDISTYETVYNDESSTLQQINDAITAIGQAIADLKGVTIEGSAENPGDATAAIENPNFDNASPEGWLGTTPNMVGSGSHGPANVPEHYNKTFDTYQSLYGLPAGVYGLSAYTFYRGSWDDYKNGTNKNAVLYATTGEVTQKHAFDNPWEAQNATSLGGATEFGTNASESSHVDGDVTYYIPNDPSAGRVYFEKGFYYNAVAFDVTDGSARIGVKKDVGVSNDWSVFDTFGLTYYGNEGAASYKAWLNDNAGKLYATEAVASTSYVNAFLAVVNGLAVTDAASANAAYETAKSSSELAALKENIAAWGQYQMKLKEAEKVANSEEFGGYAAALADYVGMDAPLLMEMAALTTAEVLAEIANIDRMIAQVKEDAANDVQVGHHVTNSWFVNCDFSNGNQGWTTAKGNITYRAGIAEAYDTNFDVYQEFTPAKKGIYQLNLQGFFRMARDNEALTMYQNGEQKTDAGVYIGTGDGVNKTFLKCVYEEEITDEQKTAEDTPFTDGGFWQDSNTGNWYANTMESATQTFAAGMYQNTAYGIVKNEGETIKIGVSGNVSGPNWICWDNFDLIFLGYEDAEANAFLLQQAMDNIDTSKHMGKSVYAAAAKAKTDGENAIASGDAAAMFTALSAIYDLNEKIEASVAVFAELDKALESLEEIISTTQNEEAAEEAGAFKEQLENDLDDYKYDDADVPGLMKQVKSWRTKMRLPATLEVGDELTDIIDSPSYSDDEGTSTSKGWEGTAAGLNAENMNAEIFNTTPFDHYQVIAGLPAGKYEVKVKAFYRAGYANEDYAAYTEGKDSCDNVVLYANGETQLIHRLAEFADGQHSGESEWVAVAEESTDYVPNSMATGHTLFDEKGDALENTVTVNVGADGELRIGLKKEIGKANDWCLFDDWTLFYVGEGEGGVVGDVNGDGAVNVADISAIIDHMAGTSDYGKVADVNGDGSVNVADISKVIDIMAGNARAAKAIEE